MKTCGDIMDLRILNAAENAILQYGREHSEFIKNVYWFFGEKLGYKSRNYLYDIFKQRNGTKLGYDDLMTILEKTGNIPLAEVIKQDIDSKIENINK